MRGRFAPDFAGLQAALSEGKTDEPGLLRSSTCCTPTARGPDRRCPCRARKARLEDAASPQVANASAMSSTSPAAGAMRCSSRPAAWTLEGVVSKTPRRALPLRPQGRDLDQGQVPGQGHEVVIARLDHDRRRLPLPGRRASTTTTEPWPTSAGSAPALAATSVARSMLPAFRALETPETSPFTGKGAPQAAAPAFTGSSRSWSPRSSTPASPATVQSARRAFKGLREDKPASKAVAAEVAGAEVAGRRAGRTPSGQRLQDRPPRSRPAP
jgi:bifunctional non-homologous end joining protein LigD